MNSAEIDALKSPAGGWTREAMASMGVPWPPPKGRRKRLLGEQRNQMAGGNIEELRPVTDGAEARRGYPSPRRVYTDHRGRSGN